MKRSWFLLLGIVAIVDGRAGIGAAKEPELLTDQGYGPIQGQGQGQVKLTKKLLEKAFPDARVVRRAWPGEGGDLAGFEVLRKGESIVHAISDEMIFFGQQWKTDKGLSIGSTYEQLQKVYPQIACGTMVMAADGSGGPTACFAPGSRIEFDMKLPARPIDAGHCKADGPACCEQDGPCNKAALRGAVVEGLVLKLGPLDARPAKDAAPR